MKKRIIYIAFSCTLLVAIVFFIISIIRTNNYNSKNNELFMSESRLFTTEDNKNDKVSSRISARSSTWGKIFDFDNVGLTENNYQAYTYDFYVSNNTADEVEKFTFKLTFSNDAYLSSAWNGALEIHQNVNNNEIVATIPDLREYNPDDYNLEYYKQDGDTFIHMYKGDFIVYIPSESTNALEMPIKSHEGTVPGMIMYVKIGETIEKSSVLLTYTFNKVFTKDVFFILSMILLALLLVAAIIYITTALQTKKYNVLHERDNKIINESIETFIGFIDAKDPYTNGHSKRVATYTRLIAEKMGFTGEDLDKIYYIALLHDCGKIGVPDNILGKPDKLTDDEFEIIKSHTVRGGEILERFKSLENVGEGARYHHERYDGKGYPEGLKGDNIPLIARMICVADSFDAMNTNRVYRKKLSREYIINELKEKQGTQFDPKIADIMLELINECKVVIE